MRVGGLDGVEFVASHGFLPAQFLNPRVNRREDDYGGSFESRLRFLRECLRAMRAAAGNDFIIGMRISSDEREEAGLQADEMLAACRALEPLVDYVNVTAGTSATAPSRTTFAWGTWRFDKASTLARAFISCLVPSTTLSTMSSVTITAVDVSPMTTLTTLTAMSIRFIGSRSCANATADIDGGSSPVISLAPYCCLRVAASPCVSPRSTSERR